MKKYTDEYKEDCIENYGLDGAVDFAKDYCVELGICDYIQDRGDNTYYCGFNRGDPGFVLTEDELTKEVYDNLTDELIEEAFEED